MTETANTVFILFYWNNPSYTAQQSRSVGLHVAAELNNTCSSQQMVSIFYVPVSEDEGHIDFSSSVSLSVYLSA
jgi:hypothetical protein